MPGRRTIAERLKYRSVDETAAELGLTPRQLRLRIEQGIVRVSRKGPGGKMLFTERDIERAREKLAPNLH